MAKHKKKKKPKLPDLPSELIRLALADLEKVERQRKYVVDMAVWHSPESKRCVVCLAGSVIAKSLGGAIGDELGPASFDEATEKKLCALDHYRDGEVYAATVKLGREWPENEQLREIVDITEYSEDPDQFHADMHRLADDLEKAGL